MLPDYETRGMEVSGQFSYTQVPYTDPNTKTGFYSPSIWLLPFMEEKGIYDQINFSLPLTTIMEKPVGTIANASYPAFNSAAGIFICPSDPNTGALVSENNYRYNFGGSTPYAGWEKGGSPQGPYAGAGAKPITASGGNGAFTIGKALKIKDFPDGLSKTAFASERSKGSLNNPNMVLPTHDDVVASGVTADFTGSLTLDTTPGSPTYGLDKNGTKMYNFGLNYKPATGSNYTSAGRWDKGDTTNLRQWE